jgi:hypothetical protein
MSLQGKDFYSKRYNIRFYHIPKNGMSSMIQTLSLQWANVNDIPKDSKTVTIVRDVYGRFLSSYNEVMMKRPAHEKGEELMRPLSKGEIESIYTDPNRYLDEIIKNGFWDGHQLTQSYYLNSETHNRSIDKVDLFIPQDNLKEELNKLGINGISHLRKRPQNLVDDTYKIFMDRKDEIYKIYEDDVLMLKNKL